LFRGGVEVEAEVEVELKFKVKTRQLVTKLSVIFLSTHKYLLIS